MVPADDLAVLDRCYGALFDVRVALHREKGRPGDVLRLEDQDAVAARLGAASADALMADVAAAARSIDWIADGAWRHVSRHQLGHEERVGDGLVVVDREVELTGAGRRRPPTRSLVLRAARVAAQRERRPGPPDARPPGRRRRRRGVGGALAGRRARRARRPAPAGTPGDRRPRGARPAGHPRAPACRSGRRCAAGRSATPTTASPSTGTCGRRRPTPPRSPTGSSGPTCSLLGALFHDIGKGYPGDHTPAGMELMQRRSAPGSGCRRTTSTRSCG